MMYWWQKGKKAGVKMILVPKHFLENSYLYQRLKFKVPLFSNSAQNSKQMRVCRQKKPNSVCRIENWITRIPLALGRWNSPIKNKCTQPPSQSSFLQNGILRQSPLSWLSVSNARTYFLSPKTNVPNVGFCYHFLHLFFAEKRKHEEKFLIFGSSLEDWVRLRQARKNAAWGITLSYTLLSIVLPLTIPISKPKGKYT